MTEIASGWLLHLDVSDEWLFIRLEITSRHADPTPPLAEKAWSVVDQHRIYRVVLELDDQVILTSHLVGQLVLFHKRCHQFGGVMRICSFNARLYDVLKVMQLDERFPNYANRGDAVMGYHPRNT